jgi:hypothetical protein
LAFSLGIVEPADRLEEYIVVPEASASNAASRVAKVL